MPEEEAKYYTVPNTAVGFVGRSLEIRARLASVVEDGYYGIPRREPIFRRKNVTLAVGNSDRSFNIVGLGVGLMASEAFIHEEGEYLIAPYPIARGDGVIGKIPLAIWADTGQRLFKACLGQMDLSPHSIQRVLDRQAEIATALRTEPLNARVIKLLMVPRVVPVAV